MAQNNWKPRRETFEFWDLVRLILETLRYVSPGFNFNEFIHFDETNIAKSYQCISFFFFFNLNCCLNIHDIEKWYITQWNFYDSRKSACWDLNEGLKKTSLTLKKVQVTRTATPTTRSSFRRRYHQPGGMFALLGCWGAEVNKQWDVFPSFYIWCVR